MSGLIVHEWVERSGGSEKVLEQVRQALPDADMFVLWNDDPARFPDARESWLARTTFRRHKALALPVLPAVWRSIEAPTAEWVLASSHLFAHHAHVKTPSGPVPKYSYVHTPARYIWEPELDGRGTSVLARAVGSALKGVDRRRSKESARMAANSEFTRSRIQRCWHRDAEVIYPPVDVQRIHDGGEWSSALTEGEASTLESLPTPFLLGASRFVPYKRLELAIEAGEATAIPVVLAGRGPQLADLKARAAAASIPVTILESPSDALLFSLYQRAVALVFPAIEDFGIMPVEAIAAGGKVIASSIGGAAESVRLLGGGTVVESYDRSGWVRAVDELTRVDTRRAQQASLRFEASRFRREMRAFVSDRRVV